jgi:hypothetical protein
MKQYPVIDTDFFFTRMRNDIVEFYRENYRGMDLHWRMRYHISVLREYYDPKNFRDQETLRINKIALLSAVQALVDSRR